MQIKLENLKKTYAGAGGTVAAVDDISLEIAENQIFCDKTKIFILNDISTNLVKFF